jgi:hypothetical protein
MRINYHFTVQNYLDACTQQHVCLGMRMGMYFAANVHKSHKTCLGEAYIYTPRFGAPFREYHPRESAGRRGKDRSS